MSEAFMTALRARFAPIAQSACAFISLLILCFGAGCQSINLIDSESAIAQNRAYTREMLAAIEAKDLDAMMARIWHSSDVIFVGPHGEIGRGWDHLRTVEQGFLESFTSASFEIENEEYAVSGDAVVSIITVKGTFTLPNRTVETARGVINGVQHKIGGKWVAIYNHFHELEATLSPEPSAPSATDGK